MYHPTTRVLTVLELLQAHGRMTGAELARRLEVHVRTARRYVTMLQDLGIPVEAERGRSGAYYLRPGFKLPPLMFSEDEAVALTLSLLAARQRGLASAAPAIEGTLAKIQRVLPVPLRERVHAVEATVLIDEAGDGTGPVSHVLVPLSTAVRAQRQVWLHYQAATGVETHRAVDPYGLMYTDRRWYVIGYCHLRAGLRLFRLDRIRTVDLGDEQFVRPPGLMCVRR